MTDQSPQARWRLKNPEKVRAMRRRNYLKHREERLAYAKRRLLSDPGGVREVRSRTYSKHREKRIQEVRDRYFDLRRQVFVGYGGRCACCGETEIRFLSIDHVQPIGNRRTAADWTGTLCRRIIRLGFPPEFQLLCHNCNHGKSRCGVCPHQGGRTRGSTNRLWMKAIQAYGSSCSCCGETEPGFLNIDHVDGGGCAHLRTLRGSNITLYSWLRANHYPPGFRVLCTNCNRAVQHGPCPHTALVTI